MVLAAVITAGKSTNINAKVRAGNLPTNRPMTSVPTLIRYVSEKTEPVLHLEHIQPGPQFINHTAEKLHRSRTAGRQTSAATGDTQELLDILT